MRVAIISLRRTKERWYAFMQRNRKTLDRCEQLRIDGIDGNALLESCINTRLISSSARERWTAGAIGIGLSHRMCWRLCCESKSPLIVLEDDVVLADDWQVQLEQLLHPGAGMVLMGWNLDSMLRAEFSNKQEIVSLFEPAYPSEEALKTIVNSDDSRQLKRLRHAFGLPGYWINPDTAKKLLNNIGRLETKTLNLGRGFPIISTNGIDGLLNLYYQQIEAEIVMPPLALALNDPQTSLTRTTPNQFGSSDI